MNYETFTIIGDSVAQGYFDETGKGWIVRLFEMLNEDKPCGYYYSDLSHSGDRTYDYFHRLGAEALTRENKNLIITLTDNDIIRHGETADSPMNVSIPLQMELWGKLLSRSKANFEKIYVVSGIPNPQGDPFISDGVKMWFLEEDLVEYQSRIKNLCNEHDIPFVNVYDDLCYQEFYDTMEDGTHPNTKGHIMIAETAYKKFKEIGF